VTPVRKATNHGKNIIGHFPSIKMGRMINFESLIERDFICLLDFDAKVQFFEEQPLAIEYLHQSKQHKYTPDFHIVFAGQNILCECKPCQFVDKPENQIKFVAARYWCDERNWLFKVVTDKHLSANWRVRNIKLLTRFSRYPISDNFKKEVLDCLSTTFDLVRIADVIQWVSPTTPQAAVIPLLHMAFHHEVFVPLNDVPITIESPITLQGPFVEKGLFLP
jgi:hypothetical protein